MDLVEHAPLAFGTFNGGFAFEEILEHKRAVGP